MLIQKEKEDYASLDIRIHPNGSISDLNPFSYSNSACSSEMDFIIILTKGQHKRKCLVLDT